jgi:hypothetical protein
VEDDMTGIAADDVVRIAEAVRAAAAAAAADGYERARLDGLCDEGALEVALDAVRSMDVVGLVKHLLGKDIGQ